MPGLIAVAQTQTSATTEATSGAAAAAASVAAEKGALPAFPGAEGFGGYTPGGRGGEVYEVTSLEDSGPGTLRDAVSKGHRTVVFRVSGNIDLKSALQIKEPFITLAGQTAPGDGICLRYFPFGVATHDVVVRFIRSRLGDLHGQEDSIDIWNGCSNLILDHCSATWSVDECLSTSGNNQNCTIQWCLIGASLNNSIHKKGEHGFGSLARANGPMSWYHNLWIHNNSRNPRLGDAYGRGSSPFFDVRNNVIYDFGGTATGLTQGTWQANYVGNYVRPGPNSKAKTPIHMGGKSDIVFYLAGNVFDGHPEITADNAKFIDKYEMDGKPVARTVNEAFPSPAFHTMSAEEALESVLAFVGACLPARDSVDARLIADVKERGGKIIDSQRDVGGWPELKSGVAPADSDHDGIPDEWEKAHGLNPNDSSDANKDLNGDGYTNLEKYLDGIDPAKKIDYREPENNVDPLLGRITGGR
ncbi:MAG: pectate lyase [Phycisphaerae bacterium]